MACGVIGTVAAVIGAGSSLYAAGKSDKSARHARNRQWRQYLETKERLAPWVARGTEGLQAFADRALAGPGPYEESPGYQFQLGEGNRNIDSGFGAGGSLGGGAHERARVRFGQGHAAQDYDRHLNRYYASLQPLQNLASMGQNAAVQTGNFGQTSVNQMNQYGRYGAQGQGGGAVGASNAVRGGLQDYMTYRAMQNNTSASAYVSKPASSGPSFSTEGGGLASFGKRAGQVPVIDYEIKKVTGGN